MSNMSNDYTADPDGEGLVNSKGNISNSNGKENQDMVFVNSAPGYEPGIARDGVNKRVLAAYSVGHFANDLCASMWFIYLSYYMVYVVKLTENIAGLGLLSGQITDGITTPIVGVLSDKVKCACGKRNAWYYAGSILVAPAFLCIFLDFQFLSGTF